MESKKRKYNEISKITLSISKIDYLKCDMCGCCVYNYQWCTSPYVYCSRDCYELIVLCNKNGYLDEKIGVKRVKSEDDLMLCDEEGQNKLFCSICGTMHSEKDRKWCEAVEEYERQESFASI